MPWPSKDPEDYRTPGRWEGREPPRWWRAVNAPGPWWLGLAFGAPATIYAGYRLLDGLDDPFSGWAALIAGISWSAAALVERRRSRA